MYEQVYTPNLRVGATAAKCLQFVDDAGNSPLRSATAKAAKQREINEGRLKGGDIPENVWVVVYFDFSRGSYTYSDGSTVYYKDAGHIALARRNGTNYEIHDSEVGRGARAPYRALGELTAWFGAYGCTYAGWSTHCDGREYAKQGGEEMGARLQSNNDVDNLYLAVLHHYPENDAIRKNWIGKTWDEALSTLRTSGEYLAQNAVVNGEYAKALAKIKELEQSKGGDAQRKLDQIKDALK